MLTPSTIACRSPPSNQSQPTSVQFLLNGVLYTNDRPPFSSDTDDEEEEEEPHIGHFPLEYVEDPQFFTANKEKLIKHHSGEQLTLIINVRDTVQSLSCFTLCWSTKRSSEIPRSLPVPTDISTQIICILTLFHQKAGQT